MEDPPRVPLNTAITIQGDHRTRRQLHSTATRHHQRPPRTRGRGDYQRQKRPMIQERRRTTPIHGQMEGIPGLGKHRRTVVKHAQRTRTPRTIPPKPPEQTETIATDHQFIKDVHQSTADTDETDRQRDRFVQQGQRRENKELGYKPPPNTSNRYPHNDYHHSYQHRTTFSDPPPTPRPRTQCLSPPHPSSPHSPSTPTTL